jgi:hypothetical protein
MGTERGEASITVELADGVITVRHGDDGTVLRQATVAEGTWSAMFDMMTTAIELGERDN